MRSYAYDPAGHPVAFTQNVSGVGTRTYYLHANAHGDVTYVTRDDGIWVKKYTYDPWGKLTNEESRNDSYGDYTTLVCPYTYAGYFYDHETGLYCMPARYYSPALRRFLTKDPHPGKKANPLTLNPYQYCENNPVMRVDPSGQMDALVILVWLLCCAINNGRVSQDRGVQAIRGLMTAGYSRCIAGTERLPGTLSGLSVSYNIQVSLKGENWLVNISSYYFIDRYTFSNELYISSRSLFVMSRRGNEYSGRRKETSNYYYRNGPYDKATPTTETVFLLPLSEIPESVTFRADTFTEDPGNGSFIPAENVWIGDKVVYIY